METYVAKLRNISSIYVCTNFIRMFDSLLFTI